MKKYLTYLFLLSLIACQKQTDWNLNTQASDKIVVDGTITNENKTQSVHITYPITQLNETPRPMTGAFVVVNDEDSTHIFTEDILNPGYYNSNSRFIGQEGHQYTLIINNNGKLYSAKSLMEPAISFHPLTYSKNTGDNLYHIDKVATSFNATQNAMWEVLLDWSAVAGYEGQDPQSCKARLLYYSLPTLDVSEVLAPQMEKISFPAGTIILEKRYSINPEHAAFIRALLSETTWTGGMFDSSHSNVPTNLSNGALGYFAACGVSSISITVVP